MRPLLILLFAVIIADSTSNRFVLLREKYGEPIIVDSVTLAIEHEGAFYITRSKKLFGVFPLVNYSFEILK
jgi:hypothetical protein